ncbi:hypothetical protein F5Y16DRAFT_419893 [Xylariaceae sp. FL0255]|nr:hypothetical protein F5Y16DRAFT_419893 [Xylariaceae sp. FL0255]
MTPFVPFNGSIAKYAIDDPRFRGCEWVFGNHKLSESFGENWSDFEAEYEAQIENFKLAQIVDELRDWISTFQKCEELILTCESGSPAELTAQSPRGPITATNLTPASAAPSSEVPPASLASSTSHQPSRRGIRGRLRDLFHRGRQPAATQAGIIVQPENAPNAVNAPPTPPEQLVSTPQTRWKEKRDEFLELLDELSLHIESYSGHLRPKESKTNLAKLLEGLRLRQLQPGFQDAGDRLKRLVSSLSELPETEQVVFQLRLYSNPFDLQPSLRQRSDNCNNYFQTNGAAFYIRLYPEPNSQLDLTQEAAETKVLIFDVSPEEEASEAGERVASVRKQLLSATPSASRKDFGTFLGHLGKTIRIVLDSTPLLPERSLFTCFTDRDEQKVLQQAGYAGVRARLAYITACSLFYSLRAEGTQDFQAHDLKFYTTLDKKQEETKYKESRIIPFVPLTTVGATAFTPSSAGTVPGAEDPEVTMIQKLGILIYEIGAWTSVGDLRLEARSLKAYTGKGRLISIHPRYPDVIDECLRFNGASSAEDWLFRYVVVPLKDVYESIKSNGVAPA